MVIQLRTYTYRVLSQGFVYLILFFSSILRCSQTGNHPQEDLAKFGYRPDMKVEKIKNPFTFWLSAGTL